MNAPAGEVGDRRRLHAPRSIRVSMGAVAVLLALAVSGQPGQLPRSPPPPGPLYFGVFTATFATDGTFTLEGQGWPSFRGTWTADLVNATLDILTPGVEAPCDGAARYGFKHVAEGGVTLYLIEDPCRPRRMILDRSTWRVTAEPPPTSTRHVTRTAAPDRAPLPPARTDPHSWPSFRGPHASGITRGMNLPDRWDGARGENILWRTPIPGLAHSSPVVWDDRLYVTTAISSNPDATFRPGLYGDGDASEDRTPHRWMIYAVDRTSGEMLWERVAHEGVPVEKRHIKSTYASSTPATDGRIVVAWFGSHGVHAYDVNGAFLWKVDLGHVDMGAYDVPTYEWGPASSPIIWNDLVILQVDTQADAFLLALDAATGETVWQTPREELPSWGTPTIADTPDGPQLVTNASNFIRGYDPRTGRELWRLGGSSKITAPTPLFAGGLWIVASGRAPERPIFAIRPSARGDVTLHDDQTTSDAVAWSRTGRGSYMPTPLAYDGLLYVLNNNGVFDAYDLRTGDEIYRQRIDNVGNGFSASPVAADGRIYLSNEDGDIIVIAAGREFRELAINPMGELLMATPALSDGVMYVRTARSLFAIGARRSAPSVARSGPAGPRLSAGDIRFGGAARPGARVRHARRREAQSARAAPVTRAPAAAAAPQTRRCSPPARRASRRRRARRGASRARSSQRAASPRHQPRPPSGTGPATAPRESEPRPRGHCRIWLGAERCGSSGPLRARRCIGRVPRSGPAAGEWRAADAAGVDCRRARPITTRSAIRCV
jgi:outer membrane protein assembly factor BamB